MTTLALVFDFDDTLVPDSTTALLDEYGIDSKAFWSNQATELIGAGYDPPLAYLNLLLREVAPNRPLQGLTNQKLSDFGREKVEQSWFLGLPALFDDLESLVGDYRDVRIEFYIISGGLQAIIEGCPTVEKYFSGVYGCQLAENPNTGVVHEVQRCVTFTEKTRFLFEISKGIPPSDSRTRPHLVNQMIPEEKRRVPLSNMIYVGDGKTDIPCFSLVKQQRGLAFAVFKPDEGSAKLAYQDFLATGRVDSMYSPDFRKDADLGVVLRAAVATKASEMQLATSQALA